MTPATLALLERAESLSQAATEGPWKVSAGRSKTVGRFVWRGNEGDGPYGRVCRNVEDEGTTYFIAASRTLVPALASELRAAAAREARLREERDTALELLNTPEIHDFAKAVVLEAAHQRKRWGVEGDAGKADADWFWLIGYLAGKALHNPDGDDDKRLHRIITVAAAAANWHAARLGQTDMRPGIDGEVALAASGTAPAPTGTAQGESR